MLRRSYRIYNVNLIAGKEFPRLDPLLPNH
jgi:hypothetical protein